MNLRLPTAILLVALCAALAQTAAQAAPPAAAADPFAGRDLSIAPGDDFFAYANGGWMQKTDIPPDRSSIGVDAQLQEQTDARVHQLLLDAVRAGAAPGTETRKIADYFATFMDEEAIEARGIDPVRPALQAIDAIGDRVALARALGSTVQADVDVLNATNVHTANILGLWVAQDLDDPAKYAPFLLQGGLGMPDRDYYVKDTARMKEIRDRYLEHVAAVLRLAGFSEPEARARRVFDLESRIAASHGSRAETVDVK